VKLDALGIVVKDLSTSVAFYRLLGLNFPDPGQGEGHLEAVTEGGLRLMLDSQDLIAGIVEGWEPRVGNTMSLAFLVDTPGEVDRLYESLVHGGAEGVKEPWDAFWGQRYACLRDPDGHGVDIFAPLA
jgi:uncharacterized glyoxalase superfamily protein PhnB